MWTTKMRTILIQKDKEKGKAAVIIDLLLASLWFGNY